MTNVYLDFEMNVDSNEKKHRTDFSIISIGAVIVNAETHEVTELHTYVKPVNGKPIYSRVTKLTGITNEDVKDAPTLSEALGMLSNAISKRNTLYVWGGFDGCALRWCVKQDESCKKYKSFAYRLVDMSEAIPKAWKLGGQISLKLASQICGVKETQEHNALSDARMLRSVCESYEKVTKKELKKVKVYDNLVRAYNCIVKTNTKFKGGRGILLYTVNLAIDSKLMMSYDEFCEKEDTK